MSKLLLAISRLVSTSPTNLPMHRFFYPGPLHEPAIELAGDEGHHLVRVLRLGQGDHVELFDGSGHSVPARVIGTTKRSAQLAPEADPQTAAPRTPSITLLTAAPKADRLRWMVEKATELGVERLTLLKTQHSVVHPGLAKLDKLNAAVISACKQCGRNDLMTIDGPHPWAEILDQIAGEGADRQKLTFLIASPDSPFIASKLLEQMGERIVMAIGPEGGWSERELGDAVQKGAIPVGFGDHILRIETAAIASASLFRLGIRDTC